MMRSMFSGVSGLRVHQTRMDVIANNISNVNTVGFKSSRVTFADMFSQTIQSASGPNPAVGRGGINPMQIGLGANVASIDSIMTTGGAQRTDYATHVMIQGDNGFFVVGDHSGTYFTRAGAFRWDEWNQLTIPNGMMVQGWRALPREQQPPGALTTVFERAVLQPVALTAEDLMAPPETTTRAVMEGNMRVSDGNLTTGTGITATIPFFDSLGNKFTIETRKVFTPGPGGGWTMQFGNQMRSVTCDRIYAITVATAAVATPGEMTVDRVGPSPHTLTVTVGAGGQSADAFEWIPAATASIDFAFTTAGRLRTTGVPADDPFSGLIVTFDQANLDTVMAPVSTFGTPTDNNIYVDFRMITQYQDPTTLMGVIRDGASAGNLIGLSIGPDGIVRGAYDNDTIRELFMIPLASFANPAGLSRAGNNLFRETSNSGSSNVTDAQVGGRSLMGGVLEMSNVDLSFEFTEMITTQRGFQANSRVITVSDDMLAELVNLKR